MKARFFLNKSTIYIAVTLQGKRVKATTGVTIDPKKWSNGYPLKSQTLVREQLNELQSLMNQHLTESLVTPMTIKAVVDKWQGNEPVNTSSVKHLISKYLEFKKETVKPITYKKVESDLNEFKEYKPAKQVTDLNKQLLDNYKSHLSKKGLEASTLNNYLKNLKAFLNWCYKNDHTSDLAKYVDKFKAESKEIIAINDNELQQLEQSTNKDGKQIDLTQRLGRICDAFLFACYTGLRYSDLSRATSSMVNDEVLTIRQQKTGNVVVIPLIYEAQKILSKHNGKVPTISHQKANEYLKELFTALEIDRQVMTSKQIGNQLIDKYQPLNEAITFHIGRKSFITIALSKGMHAKTVQMISGHKKDEIFNKYIAFSNDTLKEQMNKMSRSSRSLSIVRGA